MNTATASPEDRTSAEPDEPGAPEDTRPDGAAPDRRRTTVGETVRSGTDPDEAVAFYRDVYDSPDFSIAADRTGPTGFGFRYRTTGDGRVSLRTSSVSAPRTGLLAPQRQYLLCWSVEGNVTIDGDRDDAVRLRPGLPVMLPAGRPFRAAADPGTVHFVHFDADFLEAVAVIGAESAPVPLQFPVQAASERIAPLQSVLRAIARSMLDVGVVDGDRAVLDLRVAEAVLEAFRPAPDDVDVDAPLGTVARAKAHMAAHFDRPLTATDIAAAVEVSVRTLQEAFQRREGTTPTGYLRDLRLEKARIGLQLADARETSVAAVAQSCGFRHMGRFSGAYFAAYGEYPGDTLRGRRRLIAVADDPGPRPSVLG